MPRFLRRSVSALLCAVLLACSSGFEAQRAAAQAIVSRAVPVSPAPNVAPRVFAPTLTVPARLTPSVLLGASFLGANVAPKPIAVAASMAATAKAIGPALAVISDSKAGLEDQNSSSRRIDAVLSGQNEEASEDAAVAAPLTQSAVFFAENALRPQLPRRLTETTFVVFDLETTGFNPEIDHAMQIGAVKMRLQADGTVKVIDTYEQLIDPKVPVPAVITEFTDITNGDLKGKPTLEQVLPGLAAFAGADAIMVAHNAPFDVGFLGYRMRELGLAAMSNLVIDTKDIARSIFPGLKSYSVKDLIVAFGLGDFEAHQGLSDSMQEAAILAHALKKLAADKKTAIADLSFDELAEHSSQLRFDTILERLDPLPLPGAARPVPENFAAEADRLSKELHKQNKPSMLRDIAFAMGVDYGELSEKMRQEALRVPVASADEILAELAANPPAAVFTDYDNTLTDRGGAGVSLPTPTELIQEIEKTLKSGTAVVLTSARNFDYQPPEAVKPDSHGIVSYELYKTLISRIEPSLRGNLFFAGSLGGEIVLFDAVKGEPIPYIKSFWDVGEKERLLSVVDAALAESHIAKDELTLMHSNPNQIALIFKVVDEAKAKAFGALLRQRFKDNDILLPVLQNKQWVYFSKFEKSDATRIGYAVLRAKGYPVTPENLLFLGDEFRMPKGAPMGGDASMAMPFQGSRGISVGDAPSDPLPANVSRLGIRGSRGSLRVFRAINSGRAQEPVTASALRAFFSRPFITGAGLFLAGAAAASLFPWFIGHAAAAGAVGGLILTAIGIPQIITNLRLGSRATDDLSLASYLIWYGAAAFLTAVSLINSSSLLWVLSNIAGVVESAILAVQVNLSSPRPGSWMTMTLAVGAASIGAVAATLAGLGGTSFAVAVALLYALNVPQIAMNHALWQSEKRIPEGANPLMPALVALGSLISLMAAIGFGDVLWQVNSLIAIGTSTIVLSQLFFPTAASAMLAPVARLYARLKAVFKGRARLPIVMGVIALAAGAYYALSGAGAVFSMIGLAGVLAAGAAQPDITEADLRASARAVAAVKGGVWSESEYEQARYERYEKLKSRGASESQLAFFEKLCDEAPIIGGRFNRWSGD